MLKKENIYDVYRREGYTRYERLEKYYQDSLMKLFELYAPFLPALEHQLGPEFIRKLPEQNIYIAYRNHKDSGKLNQGDIKVAYRANMLEDISTQKQLVPFQYTYYLAWLIFIFSLMPVQYKYPSPHGSNYTGLPTPVFTGFSEVHIHHLDIHSFVYHLMLHM